MNKRTVLVVLVLSMFIVTGADARERELTLSSQALATHDVVVDAVSWRSFPITCAAGDTLSGEFTLISEGTLFPGDQTVYDNWLLGGIDFLIFDESNYNLWTEDMSATPLFELQTLVKLSWSVEIPYEGVWYVVYFNDSVFIKQIEGSIIHSGSIDLLVPLIGIIGAAVFLAISFRFWKKK